MRIRTDGEYAHREETIEAAAERFGCNKTKAVLISCEIAGDLLDGLEDALNHPELPPRVREELVEEISTRRINITTSTPETAIRFD